MNDDDPQAVKRMLFYLYNLDYPDHAVPKIQAEHAATGRSTPPSLRHKTQTTSEEVTNMGADLGISEGATSTHDPRMMNNVLVYAIAEKYDIPDLKDMSRGKFHILARSKWPHDDFYTLAEEVFSTTPDTDMGLRRIVVDLCEEHFQDILKNKDSRAGLLGIPAVGAVVFDAAVRKFDKSDQDRVLLDETLAKEIVLKKELSKAKKDAEEARDEQYDWNERLDTLLGKGGECGHCHRRFGCHLERETFPSLDTQLRCGNCYKLNKL